MLILRAHYVEHLRGQRLHHRLPDGQGVGSGAEHLLSALEDYLAPRRRSVAPGTLLRSVAKKDAPRWPLLMPNDRPSLFANSPHLANNDDLRGRPAGPDRRNHAKQSG